jgi:translation initiation factor IF-1
VKRDRITLSGAAANAFIAQAHRDEDLANAFAHTCGPARKAIIIEEHRGGVWMRHLSVAVGEEGKLPNEIAVQELAREFGFKGRIPNWMRRDAIWVERGFAINVLEPLDYDPAKDLAP